MNILVTGGAGFIGSNLCLKLISYGHKVSVIDNLSPQVHGNLPKDTSPTYTLIKDKVRFICADVCDSLTWAIFLGEEFDCIICLASETGTGQSMFESYKYCNTNIGSIAILNDLIVRGQIKTRKIILASSRSVYGEALLDSRGNPIATKENDKLDPKSIYAITKLTQEQLLFAGFGHTQVCALRFQNVYGPGQSLTNPYTGILSIFSNAIKNNQDIQLFDDGLMSRDFVYIDDVVESICICLHSNEIDKEVFNVGSGIKTTVLEVAETLLVKYDSKVKINITGEKMAGDIRHNFADISKLKKLGFNPSIKFSDGVEKFVDWVNLNKNLEYNSYDKTINDLRNKGLLIINHDLKK